MHDNIWLFGYGSDTNTEMFGGSTFDFSQSPPDTSSEYRNMYLDVTNASICDTEGNLLFYTNGIYIANAEHQPMEGGEGLSPSQYTDDNALWGMRLIQGALTLPHPASNNRYYLIHEPYEYPGIIDWHAPRLYYSLIDMNENMGLGAVVEKNVEIFEANLDHGKISAVKHANGRDWWVLVLGHSSNKYHRILISDQMVQYLETQSVGNDIPNGIGQATFSPDGSKYVLYNLHHVGLGNYLNIYDFDRCSGLLSNHQQFNMIDSAWAGGIAISPSSQFLYVSSYDYIYQYDLQASDIEASKDTVAVYDGFQIQVTPTFFLNTRFFLAQLGPDGKIYINCPGSPNILHVIHEPDLPGEACNVEQHAIHLPTYNNSSLPNFPNYRLGALEGSPCDTLLTTSIGETTTDEMEISFFPNPAADFINIDLQSAGFSEAVLSVYDLYGQVLWKQIILNGNNQVDLGTLHSGLYFFEVVLQDRVVAIEKINVIR